MYEFIQGAIAGLNPAAVVIESGGVGYLIHISLNTFTALNGQKQARIFTHFIVRDDAHLLYGFAGKAERELFRNLLSVSGVGAATALMMLELFERIAGVPFTEFPGALFKSRVAAIAKVLSNIFREAPATVQPTLLPHSRRSLVYWNRRPRVPVDVVAWRQRTLEAEEFAAPIDSRVAMAAADADLAAWVRLHPHLHPADLERGESPMALLILWEVDH